MYDANIELGDYAGTIKHETEKALLIDHGGKEPVWIPKSQIKDEKRKGNEISFSLPTWLAIEKGME